MEKSLFYILVISTLTFGCGHPAKNNSNYNNFALKKDSLVAKIDTTQIIAKNWADTLIKYYISCTKNDMIKIAIQDNISEKWIFDQMINTDTAKYFRFQIGHDVSDSGGMNLRFTTDSWIYIDSVTKKIYEYDLPNDSLTEWKK
ncbi:MAG TPA: hypothetical protein VNG53_00305 [Bacteroidia bacterium]|nr:hypothetical protein [Bacteroidia bacterium]